MNALVLGASLSEATGRVRVEEDRDQGLIRQALLERAFLYRVEVLARARESDVFEELT